MIEMRKTFVSLFFFLLFSGTVNAKEGFLVGDVDRVDTSEQMLLISDSSYRYDAYLVVQYYGESDDQRLPVSYLKRGQKVAVSSEVSKQGGKPKATRIIIFNNNADAVAFDKAR